MTTAVESTVTWPGDLMTREAERTAHPYAVGIRYECEPRPTYEAFSDKLSAKTFADIMDALREDTGIAAITLWVSVDGREWAYNPVVWGWRQVTAFNLDAS